MVGSGFLNIYPGQQVKFTGEKYKCAPAENPGAHWAIRSTPRRAGAQRCAGCNSDLLRSNSLWKALTYTFPHHKH